MIKLNSETFARAISKAQTVRPRVECANTDETNFTFYVERSARTGAFAVVDIWHRGGTLWSSCDCPAGADRAWPLPCYHVAAAALSFGLLPAALPLGAVADPKPEGAAGRQVPPPLIDIRELAPIAPAETETPARDLWRLVRTIAARFAWLSTRSARA